MRGHNIVPGREIVHSPHPPPSARVLTRSRSRTQNFKWLHCRNTHFSGEQVAYLDCVQPPGWGEFPQRVAQEVLRALAADCRAALATMMLPLPKAELHNTDEALVDFLHGPERPLCHFEALKPSQKGAFAHIGLCHRHAHNAHGHTLLHFDSRDLAIGRIQK